MLPLKFLPVKSKKRINFNCILFEVNIFVKKLEKQYLKKTEKADEERLAMGVQKYPCLYDKAVSAFHNNNQKKNAWEAVAKDIGLETRETAKNAFTSLRTKYVRRKKTLKDLKRSGTDAEKVMKAEKDMREYLFVS